MILTDGAETEGEMAEEGLWEPLVIIETGDMMSASERRGESSSVASDHNRDAKHTLKEEEKDKNEDSREGTMCSEHHKEQSEATEEENEAEESKNTDEEQNECATQQVGQTHEKVPESLEDDGKVAKNQQQVDTECSTSCEPKAKGTNSPEEDAKQVCRPFFCPVSDISQYTLSGSSVSLSFFVLPPVLFTFFYFQSHRLTPDFPEALYELLCTLQEGRRLNDQRCSFRLESGVTRRRCHSEPNTTKPANRGRAPLRKAAFIKKRSKPGVGNYLA